LRRADQRTGMAFSPKLADPPASGQGSGYLPSSTMTAMKTRGALDLL
jgi:hypothetical protein